MQLKCSDVAFLFIYSCPASSWHGLVIHFARNCWPLTDVVPRFVFRFLFISLVVPARNGCATFMSYTCCMLWFCQNMIVAWWKKVSWLWYINKRKHSVWNKMYMYRCMQCHWTSNDIFSLIFTLGIWRDGLYLLSHNFVFFLMGAHTYSKKYKCDRNAPKVWSPSANSHSGNFI